MNPRPRYISSPALLFLSFFSFFLIHASTPHFLRLTHPFLYSIFFLFFFSFFKIDVKLIFVYHPMSEETLVATNASIEGFFEGVEIFAKAMTSTQLPLLGKFLLRFQFLLLRPFLLRMVPLLREASLGSPPLFLLSLLPLWREPLP